MRIAVASVLVTLGLALSGCATTDGNTASACADMIAPGSSLDMNLKAHPARSHCAKFQDTAGHPGTELRIQLKLDPTVSWNTAGSGFAPEQSVLINRYDQNFGKPEMPDQTKLINGFQSSLLNTSVPVMLGNARVPATAFRLDDIDSKVTWACLYAATTGAKGTPSEAILCRTVGRGAKDADAVKAANDIAAEDFPAIRP